MEKEIIYFGVKTTVSCDGKCEKAWGRNSRPYGIEDSPLSDEEIEWNAPADPGTYEGGDGKPKSNREFPNKWCVRECERSVLKKFEDL